MIMEGNLCQIDGQERVRNGSTTQDGCGNIIVEKGKFERNSGAELSLSRGNFGNIFLWKVMTDKPKQS